MKALACDAVLHWRKMTLAVAAVLAVALPQAQAQDGPYRSGEPAVLQGQPDVGAELQRARQRQLADYQAAYRRAGSPKFLMFWHRELSDKISSARELQLAQSRSGPAIQNNFEQIVKIHWQDGSERAVSLLPAAQNAEFETGFHQALRAGGTLLVDRNTAIRMTALDKTRQGKREEDMNFQTVEATALADFAQYFIEVRMLPSAGAQPEARVTVIASRSGEILADVMSSDPVQPVIRPGVPSEQGYIGQVRAPGAAPGEWATDERGFVRRAAPARTARDDGQAVAALLMRAMADAWNGAPLPKR